MTLEANRESNKCRVITHALACFMEKGIEAATISEIAGRAGLTERSVYRYFETKSDLVLETALLIWDETMRSADARHAECMPPGPCGLERIRLILSAYAELYFTNRDGLLFVHEAEAYLNRHGKALLLKNKPPAPYENNSGPLAKAIRLGIRDGSVCNSSGVALLYYNAYDALLGLLQKMAIDSQSSPATAGIDPRRRLACFCDLLTEAFRR